MGGKFRQGKIIAEFAHRVLTSDKVYVEPFCGALGSASQVAHNRMILNDVCKPLILMWKGVYEGTITLPDSITEEQYNHYKQTRDMDDWMTAFCGFGISFGGKWFGGYARHTRGVEDPEYYVQGANRDINRKFQLMNGRNIKFSHLSYDQLKFPNNSVVYCDPPYEKRTKAHSHSFFDTPQYYDWCRSIVFERHIPLLVTAFEIPDDFRVLHSWGDTVVRHYAGKGSDGTNEVLACHRTQFKMFTKGKDNE